MIYAAMKFKNCQNWHFGRDRGGLSGYLYDLFRNLSYDVETLVYDNFIHLTTSAILK
jgi:hypothetical protein